MYRLKKTKASISHKYQKQFDELERLVSNNLNYKNLRAKVHVNAMPLIPFPGVYQSDLVYLDSCNKSVISGLTHLNLVNFNKLEKSATLILELAIYQKNSYSLTPVVEIQEYIKKYPELDENKAYDMSLLCEPKNIPIE